MDTISLYYFTEAAKDLNFTQTANRLFLSQQNLSSHIARLESKCGCKLFQRKPKVQLTYEGELFLAYGSTHEQDLYRVNTLRVLGYDPYVMIYERPTAPKITRHLQRWVNNKRIFHTVKDFKDYAPMKKEVH